MATKTSKAANFNMTHAEVFDAIRQMGLTCVRTGDSQYRVDYRHADPCRIEGVTAYSADSLAAAYEKALVLRDWSVGFYRLAKRLKAAAAEAAGNA